MLLSAHLNMKFCLWWSLSGELNPGGGQFVEDNLGKYTNGTYCISSKPWDKVNSFSRANESFKFVPTEAELLLSVSLEELGSEKSKCNKWCYTQTGVTYGDGSASPLANLNKQPRQREEQEMKQHFSSR